MSNIVKWAAVSDEETFAKVRVEFSFGDEVKDGPMSLGMHKRGSFYDVVTTGECHIVHPDFCKILVCTKEYFEEKKVGF